MNYYEIHTFGFEWRAHTRVEDMEGIPTLNEVTIQKDYEVDWDNLPNNTLSMTLYNFKTQQEDWEELDPFNSDTIPINTGMIEYDGGYPPTAHISNVNGFMVSEKLKNILREFDFPPHQIINIDLKSCLDLKDIRRFYYFHFDYNLYDHLDFSKCKYQIKDTKDRRNIKILKEDYGSNISIHTRNDYRDQIKALRSEKIRPIIIEFHLSENINIPDVSQNSFIVNEPLRFQLDKLVGKVKGFYGGNTPIKHPVIIAPEE